MNPKVAVSVIAVLFTWSTAIAQIPVELFGGNQRATLDLMFFKYFRNNQSVNSPWLFFNRNRAGIDYRMTTSSYLPQFGFTEAISWNHHRLRGFAPVMVVQLLNTGVYPKAGCQYAHIRKGLTVFSWLVAETRLKPDLDYFLLIRYTPVLSGNVKLFTQFESINTLPTVSSESYLFTQRLRLGISAGSFQCGLGLDMNQSGRVKFSGTHNVGAFIRHEF